jgi:hypothetical protein
MREALLGAVYDSLASVRPAPAVEIPWSAEDAAAMNTKAAEPSNFDGDDYRRRVGGARHHYRIGASHLLVAGGRPSAALLASMATVLAAFGANYASHKPYTIHWFMNESRRSFPAPGHRVGPKHINGGYCMACDPRTIVIYRREDALRVLIHELQHATCMDNHELSEPEIEAKTEAWAEIIYAMLAAVRLGIDPATAWAVQAGWSAAQNERLQAAGVRGPADYAWRYTVGKEAVWQRMGLWPSRHIPKSRSNSLQLGAPLLDVV